MITKLFNAYVAGLKKILPKAVLRNLSNNAFNRLAMSLFLIMGSLVFALLIWASWVVAVCLFVAYLLSFMADMPSSARSGHINRRISMVDDYDSRDLTFGSVTNTNPVSFDITKI